jgi:hypothetical protein
MTNLLVTINFFNTQFKNKIKSKLMLQKLTYLLHESFYKGY